MSNPNKPASLQRYIEDAFGRELAEQAEPYPRDYFRASELGYCARSIYYARTGETPRPNEWGDKARWIRGNAMGDGIQYQIFDKWFVMDGIEGRFYPVDGVDDKPGEFITTYDLYMDRARSRANKLTCFKWISHDIVEHKREPENYDIHVRFEWKGVEMEIHLRPDGIITGLRHPTDGDVIWPIEDHDLLEIKTVQYGTIAHKIRYAAPTKNTNSFGFMLVHCTQAIITAFFMGLDRTRMWVQTSDDPTNIVCDDFQAQKTKQPEFQWEPIPTDLEYVEVILDRMLMIEQAIQTGEPPDFGCWGPKGDPNDKNKVTYEYMGCNFNDRMTAGKCSSTMCTGRRGAK